MVPNALLFTERLRRARPFLGAMRQAGQEAHTRYRPC